MTSGNIVDFKPHQSSTLVISGSKQPQNKPKLTVYFDEFFDFSKTTMMFFIVFENLGFFSRPEQLFQDFRMIHAILE